VTLYEKYNQLSAKEKGGLIGHAIGKYGVDIISGYVTGEGLLYFAKLKNANRVCNFESMMASPLDKVTIIGKAEQHHVESSNFLKIAEFIGVLRINIFREKLVIHQEEVFLNIRILKHF
jgi:hypothetical protein